MTGDAHTRLDLLLGLRRFREAEKLARECLAAEPDCSGWHSQLARALAGRGRTEEALETARTAAGLAPENPWTLSILAWLLNQAGRPGEALEVLRTVLRLDPHYSWGHELLAIAYEQLGRGKERLMAARKAVELAPEDESPWVQFGWALYANKQYGEALQAADTGLRLHPDSAPLHNLRGSCLMAQGEATRRPRRFRVFRMAHDSLLEAVRLDPGEPAYARNLLANTAAWRRVAYRWGVAVGLVVLFVGGYAIGYLFVGHLAMLVAVGLAVLALLLREPLLNPPDYGLAMLPLGWAGLPDVPMTSEDRSQGRWDWLRWVGGIFLGLLLLAEYIGVRACISSVTRR
jgi:tetratricopeptide (TPR) repeat protein